MILKNTWVVRVGVILFMTQLLMAWGCGSAPKKRQQIVYYETIQGKIYQIPVADRMLIKTEEGVTKVVLITDDTEFKKDGDDGKFKDLKEGDYVKIKCNVDPDNNVFLAGSIETGEKNKNPASATQGLGNPTGSSGSPYGH